MVCMCVYIHMQYDEVLCELINLILLEADKLSFSITKTTSFKIYQRKSL